jgi:hypothetical protein
VELAKERQEDLKTKQFSTIFYGGPGKWATTAPSCAFGISSLAVSTSDRAWEIPGFQARAAYIPPI